MITSGSKPRSRYTAVIFGEDAGVYQRSPAVITKSKQVISLPGRNVTSYIDCGSSDATLKVTGAFSLEWVGALKYADQAAAAVGIDQMLICRSIGIAENSGTPGTISTAGNFSYGIASLHLDDTNAGFQNNMFVVTGNYLDIRQNITDVMTCSWRTGVQPPLGNKFGHWVVT